ncbi:MAG: tetratricopeptide repeat protein [Planctomycetota bacterium]|jgi:tetratricopeptide (TPR) repeat protein
MPRRYFNWKLAVVLLIGFVVLGATAFGLRWWRRSTRSARGLEIGIKAYDEHRWEEAAANLGRYLAVERDDVPIILKYANAQLNIRPLKRNNLQQAIASYRTALREEKNNSEAVTRLTELYLEVRMPGEAELIATRYLEINQDLKLRRMLTVALARQRKFDEAATELKDIITKHPEQILAYETLGQLAERRPEDFPHSAAHFFDEAVRNNPSSALAYMIRAAFNLRSNDRPKALADLEQADKLDLSEPIIRLRLAGEFINVNVFDKAEKHLQVVQAVDPANQLLWRTWAMLALKSNSKTTMLKVAETGLKELASQPWDFMPTAAELYIRCDELGRAGDCISKLHQKEIAPKTTAFLEGFVADREGRLSEAVKRFRRAVQLGSKPPPQQVRLALASTLSRLGDTQSALRQLRTLVSERPNLFEARLALARLLAQTGNWAETAEQARIAGQTYPNSLDAALLHIQARMKLLAASPTSENAQMWQDIEDQLTVLENTSGSVLKVKLLQLKCLLQQSNFTDAETLVMELKESHPSQIGVAMAEVELLIAQNKTGEAILKLTDVVSVFPESINSLGYLATLLAAEGKTKECENLIKDTLTRVKQPAVKRDLGLLLAGFYNRWDEPEKRYLFLNLLARDLPDDILVQRELLRCEKVIRDSDRAQQIVNKIKSIEGEEGWQWRYEQAKIWSRHDNFKDRYQQIISLLKENLLANPDDQANRMLLAQSYERAGQLQLAIVTYRETLDRSPGDIRIIVAYVNALYKTKEYDLADKILQRAVGEKLFHPELKKLELQSFLRRGELGHAGDVMECLLTDDPNNTDVLLSLARIKMWQNKFAEADQLLNKLKIQEPNSLQVTVAQVELNVRQGKSDEAIQICDEMVDNFSGVSAYIIRARTFVSIGEPNKAIEDFEHAATIEPNSVEAWVAKSDFYSSIGQPDKAIDDILQALSIDPNNLQIQKRAMSLYLATGNPDRVLQGKSILDKALAANPEDSELSLYKARLLLAEGTAPAIQSAEQILRKITEDQPKISEAWMLLGELSLRKGESGKAIDIALRGLVHKPNDRTLLLLKAQAEAKRSPLLAIPTLKLLCELDPNDVDAVVLLANTYIEVEEHEKAVNLLRKQLVACNGIPDERKVNIALFRALYKNGDKTDAQKVLDSLLQSAPDDPGPLLTQVRLLKDDRLWSQLNQMVIDWCRNHPEDRRTPIVIARDLAAAEDSQAKKMAEDLFRKILDRDSNSLPAMNSLAMLLQMTSRPVESATLYQRILTLQPDNIIVINNLAWILCEEQGKHKEALQLAKRGLEIAPNYADLIDTRGVAYYRLGQCDKAVQCFTGCLKLYPKGMSAVTATHVHFAKALACLEQNEKAIENLNKALQLNAEIGGLSAEDVEETQRLIEELSRGS